MLNSTCLKLFGQSPESYPGQNTGIGGHLGDLGRACYAITCRAEHLSDPGTVLLLSLDSLKSVFWLFKPQKFRILRSIPEAPQYTIRAFFITEKKKDT